MLPELLYHIFFFTPIRIKGRIDLLKTAEIAHLMQVSFACSRRVDDLTHKKGKSSYGKCSSAQGCRTNSAFGLFLAIMIVACLWIVQPFILALHGPVQWLSPPGRYCYVCKDHVWSPLSRRSGDDAVISDGFIIPIALLVNSIVDGSGPLIKPFPVVT